MKPTQHFRIQEIPISAPRHQGIFEDFDLPKDQGGCQAQSCQRAQLLKCLTQPWMKPNLFGKYLGISRSRGPYGILQVASPDVWWLITHMKTITISSKKQLLKLYKKPTYLSLMDFRFWKFWGPGETTPKVESWDNIGCIVPIWMEWDIWFMLYIYNNTTHLTYIKIWGMPQNCHVNRKQRIVDHKILK